MQSAALLGPFANRRAYVRRPDRRRAAGVADRVGPANVRFDGGVHDFLVGRPLLAALPAVFGSGLVADGGPLNLDVEAGQGAALGGRTVAAADLAVFDHDVVRRLVSVGAQQSRGWMRIDLAEPPLGIVGQVAVFEQLHTISRACLAPSQRAELAHRMQRRRIYFGHGCFSLDLSRLVIVDHDGSDIPVDGQHLAVLDSHGTVADPEHGGDAVFACDDGAVRQDAAHVCDQPGGMGE